MLVCVLSITCVLSSNLGKFSFLKENFRFRKLITDVLIWCFVVVVFGYLSFFKTLIIFFLYNFVNYVVVLKLI